MSPVVLQYRRVPEVHHLHVFLGTLEVQPVRLLLVHLLRPVRFKKVRGQEGILEGRGEKIRWRGEDTGKSGENGMMGRE